MALVSGYLILSTRGRGLVPGRLQLVSEMFYEFVANTVRNSAGTEGMRFFPFVFTLFSFLLLGNLFGIVPYFFTITSHVIIPAALALLVMAIVIVYGFMRNGLGFLKLFVPSGIPAPILVIVVPIEILSLHLAAAEPFPATVRQHAGRPHRAEGVRRLRRHAVAAPASSASSAPSCRSA